MLKGSRKSKADEPTVIVIDPGASHNDENKAVTDPGDERMVHIGISWLIATLTDNALRNSMKKTPIRRKHQCGRRRKRTQNKLQR